MIPNGCAQRDDGLQDAPFEYMLELSDGKSTSQPKESSERDAESGTTSDTVQSPAALAEDDLIRAAKNGDAQAFGELIERHRSACLKRAMHMIRNRDDAEDEVQTTFWKAFERLEQFRGDGSFGGWLSRILENQCLMRIRESRNARFIYLDESTDADIRIELVGQCKSPEDEFGAQEVIKLMRREISRIPPLFRNVMLLRDLCQLPMPDVALQLGVSIPAAKSRLMRARAELRSRVSKHCGRKGSGTLTHIARHSQTAYTRAS